MAKPGAPTLIIGAESSNMAFSAILACISAPTPKLSWASSHYDHPAGLLCASLLLSAHPADLSSLGLLFRQIPSFSLTTSFDRDHGAVGHYGQACRLIDYVCLAYGYFIGALVISCLESLYSFVGSRNMTWSLMCHASYQKPLGIIGR